MALSYYANIYSAHEFHFANQGVITDAYSIIRIMKLQANLSNKYRRNVKIYDFYANKYHIVDLFMKLVFNNLRFGKISRNMDGVPLQQMCMIYSNRAGISAISRTNHNFFTQIAQEMAHLSQLCWLYFAIFSKFQQIFLQFASQYEIQQTSPNIQTFSVFIKA